MSSAISRLDFGSKTWTDLHGVVVEVVDVVVVIVIVVLHSKWGAPYSSENIRIIPP